ncbi:MAG: hypothetical protein IJB76_01065 [Clostridia bacterium]|nr:hypothetical protein [Clostridia bacterium]
MKKLLVMLLAVSMVLTMAFSFAACGGDEEETSSNAPTSSTPVEDDSDEAPVVSEDEEESIDAPVASEEVSTEVIESGDASAEESTEGASEEESADAPIESTEEPDSSSASESESTSTPESSSSGNVGGSNVVLPAGKTNYAAGKSYTILRGLTDPDPASCFLPDATGGTTYEYWGDVNLTKLTDGKTATGKDMGPNGSLEGVTVTFVGTNQIFEYVIDLGESYSDIKSVVFCGVRDGVQYKNNRGFNTATTMIYVTDTKGTWGSKIAAQFTSEQLADAPLIKHQTDETSENVENFTYTYTFDSAASGRYVRILLSSPVYCMQFDEILVLN